MPRTIWTKLQTEPNGAWTRHEGEPPFSIPATGGVPYDLRTDSGESFVITPTITLTAPQITGLPSLAGTAEVSQTLTATAAPATGTAPITTSWQWLRDGTEIAGMTSASYMLIAADEGTAISVRQTVSNAQGSDNATSASVTISAASSVPAQMLAPVLTATAFVVTVDKAAAPSDGGSPIIRYDLRYSTDETNWMVVQDTSDPHDILGRAPSTLYYVQTRAVNDVDVDPNNWSISASVTTAASTASGSISSIFVQSQEPDGVIQIDYQVSADMAVTGVISTAVTKPTMAQVLAGQDASGTAAVDTFTDNWTTSGGDTNFSIADGLADGIYYLHVLPLGGSDGDVTTSNGFQLDTVAPVVSSAEVAPAGDRVILTISKPLQTIITAGDWAVREDGALVAIQSVSITNDTISINLNALVTPGAAVSVDYTGSNVIDLVSNPLAPLTGQVVTNNVTVFAETEVSVPALDDGLAAPAGSTLSGIGSVLLFASYQQAFDGRSMLMSFNGQNGSVHADYGSGDGLAGPRVRFYDGLGNNEQYTNYAFALGNRAHVLVSAVIDSGGTMRIKSATRDVTAGGGWVNGPEGTANSAAGQKFLSPDLVHVLARSDDQTHDFFGSIWRNAMWVSTGDTVIADVHDPGVQANFGDASGIVNPAAARTVYGTPVFDFSGPATEWNAGIHAGSLGAFTKLGTQDFT